MIDDDAMVRRAMVRLLDRHHDVIGTDGSGALGQIAEEDTRFDVVLCDLMMPGVDGPAIHAAIAETAPHLLDRMVFVSGGVFTPRVRAFVETHQIEVVRKPLAKDALLEIVDKLGGA